MRVLPASQGGDTDRLPPTESGRRWPVGWVEPRRMRKAAVAGGVGGAEADAPGGLCPVDFSDPSRRALHEAADLARAFDADLTLLHV